MEDEKKCRVGGMYESNLLLGVALHYLCTFQVVSEEFPRWVVSGLAFVKNHFTRG